MLLCPAVSPINPEQLEEVGFINRHVGPHVDPHYHCSGRVVAYHREQSPETRSMACSQPVHPILYKLLVSLSAHEELWWDSIGFKGKVLIFSSLFFLIWHHKTNLYR